MNQILSYIHIKQNQVSVDGKLISRLDRNLKLADFLSEAYKSMELSYPKFHKMDLMCKLGFLATEILFNHSDFIETENKEKMAIILSNNASSLDTDRIHQNSISNKNNYFPSPAVFVYTLPNIVIGEIAIKYKITGENAFFVTDKLNATLLSNYTDILLNTSQAESAICGWVNIDDSDYEAFIFLVRKAENINKNSIFKPLNHLNVIEIYNQTTWML